MGREVVPENRLLSRPPDEIVAGCLDGRLERIWWDSASGNGVVEERTDVQRETWRKLPRVSRTWNYLNAFWLMDGGRDEGVGDSCDESASLGPCYTPGHDGQNSSPCRTGLSKE